MDPRRTLDTMSEAIAMSSPSGRMSERSRKAARKRLSAALFGPNGEIWQPTVPDKTEYDMARIKALTERARLLHSLADSGLHPRRNRKEARRCEQEAHDISTTMVGGSV